MCVPDLCVLKNVVLGYKGYNLGAIVARRLHNNSRKGDLFGGIYATPVANYLNIAPREGDMILPPVYVTSQIFNLECYTIDHHCISYLLHFWLVPRNSAYSRTHGESWGFRKFHT